MYDDLMYIGDYDKEIYDAYRQLDTIDSTLDGALEASFLLYYDY